MASLRFLIRLGKRVSIESDICYLTHTLKHFSRFLRMTKNIHIEHPEDSILTGDLTVLDAFLMPQHLSVKYDGAPAIVWGTNPATGNFFVGTKSVFNKRKIKINECHADIDKNRREQSQMKMIHQMAVRN